MPASVAVVVAAAVAACEGAVAAAACGWRWRWRRSAAAAVDGDPISHVKHDIVLLGHLGNGIGFYRFSYNGSDKAYVGVMAQDVQLVEPNAVTRGQDGYLRVFYDKVGVKFQTYEQWIASGARVPVGVPVSH